MHITQGDTITWFLLSLCVASLWHQLPVRSVVGYAHTYCLVLVHMRTDWIYLYLIDACQVDFWNGKWFWAQLAQCMSKPALRTFTVSRVCVVLDCRWKTQLENPGLFPASDVFCHVNCKKEKKMERVFLIESVGRNEKKMHDKTCFMVNG